MKVKIVKGKGVKNRGGNQSGEMEVLKRNVLESCTRTIAEAQAIAAVVCLDENDVLELIARTLCNYAKRSREDE